MSAEETRRNPNPIRLHASIGDRSGSVTPAVQEARIEPHFQKMFVTKQVRVLARLVSRHIPSFRTTPSALHRRPCASGTRRLCPNTLIHMPADFRCQEKARRLGELGRPWPNSIRAEKALRFPILMEKARVRSVGRGSTGPGLMVSQTGGDASFAQPVLGFLRSARVIPPRLLVLIG